MSSRNFYGKKPLRGRARGATRQCARCGAVLQARFMHGEGGEWVCKAEAACTKRRAS